MKYDKQIVINYNVNTVQGLELPTKFEINEANGKSDSDSFSVLPLIVAMNVQDNFLNEDAKRIWNIAFEAAKGFSIRLNEEEK